MCRDSIEKSYYFSTWLNAPIQILPTMPTIPSMCLCLLCLLCPSSWYAKILHSIKLSIVPHPHVPVLSAQYYMCSIVQSTTEYYSSTQADCPPDQVIMGTDFIHRAGMPIALEPSTQGPLKSDWMIFGIFIDAQAPITGALVCHMVHHTTNSLLIVHFAL